MAELRRIHRHQLTHYLQVFNLVSGKPIGYIGNISTQGLMLVSQLPMLVGARFDLHLKVPAEDGQFHYIDFQADCQWSREDVTPGTFDSGFALVAPPADYVQMVAALHDYFSFVPDTPAP